MCTRERIFLILLGRLRPLSVDAKKEKKKKSSAQKEKEKPQVTKLKTAPPPFQLPLPKISKQLSR